MPNAVSKNLSGKTLYLTKLALLMAIMFVMSFTPIGYLKVGIIEITFMTIPVIVGAITMGPFAGAFLGGIFGLTSFIQCFGMSPFGAALLAINPVYTFILCMVPRVLMGYLAALLFKVMFSSSVKGIKFISFEVSSLACALLNTVLFMGGLILMFGRTEYIMGLRGDMDLFAFLVASVGLNGLVEAITCFILGAGICRALMFVSRRNKKTL